MNEDPPLLLFGGCLPPPAMKLLTAAFRLYSSSIARLRRFFINKNVPPTMAAIATSPTTTPAAIPALLDPPDFAAVAVLLAVTKTVCPPITDVTTDGFEDAVAEGDDSAVLEGLSLGSDEDPPLAKSTLVVVVLVRYADAYIVPPPPNSRVSSFAVNFFRLIDTYRFHRDSLDRQYYKNCC